MLLLCAAFNRSCLASLYTYREKREIDGCSICCAETMIIIIWSDSFCCKDKLMSGNHCLYIHHYFSQVSINIIRSSKAASHVIYAHTASCILNNINLLILIRDSYKSLRHPIQSNLFLYRSRDRARETISKITSYQYIDM